jgi:RNA polymerase sigma factor FliA
MMAAVMERGASAIGPERNPDALVARHAPLVKRIAYHLVGRLPANVQVEDLIQAGMIGLLEAARRFDPAHGASFETYAGIRIRGHMLDEVRRGGWSPRAARRKARQIAAAMNQVEQASGGEARDADVAAALGVEIAEYHALRHDAARFGVVSITELTGADGEDDDWLERVADHHPSPAEDVESEETLVRVAAAIERLPEREKIVMSMYYDDELNLREIGAVLGVTESRICQIHGQAVVRLRGWLAER